MSNTEEKKDFNKIFENERAEWKERIQVIALQMKDIKTLAKAQVDLFSQRQVLLEYSYKLASIVSKLNSKSRVEKSKKLKEYSERSDVRYGANEKTVLIDGDLTEIAEKVELVESHRKFIDQTIQTVDHMLYGVKSRIALEDYLRGSTVK
jgi:hypothetical protein